MSKQTNVPVLNKFMGKMLSSLLKKSWQVRTISLLDFIIQPLKSSTVMLIPRVDCITKNLAILITGSFYCVGKYILVLPFAKPSTFRISSAALIPTNIKSSNDIVRTCQLFFYKEDNTFPINLLRTGTFVSLLNNSHHTSFILC